ncbi:phosphonate C-P lyase system protein PhnH [Mariniluteicoccus flavus]
MSVTEAPRTVLLDESERQEVFRACLDALARPGTVHDLGCHRHDAARLPLLALTDLMTPVAALGGAQVTRRAIDEIAGLTRAPLSAVSDARWLLAGDDLSPDLLRTVPRGTDEQPQLGAVVVVPVSLDAGGPDYVVTGPGIRDELRITISLAPGCVRERARLMADYPQGFDLLCVTDDHRVLGLPRTTVMEQAR